MTEQQTIGGFAEGDVRDRATSIDTDAEPASTFRRQRRIAVDQSCPL